MTSSNRWSDLERPPLNETALRHALLTPSGLWTSLDVVAATGSTNTDLVARAKAGAAEGAVLIAEEQSAGRGRLERRWTAPARSGLFFSILLRPGLPTPDGNAALPVDRWGWLPLLAGVATATAVSRTAGIDTALKWPNDLLVKVPKDSDKLRPGETPPGEERKAAGILAERADDTGIVIGVGLNVTLREDELPVPTATSLALAGAPGVDRDPLLRAVLRSIAQWYQEWRAADGDPHRSRLQEAYAAGCATLGRTVRAELPGGRELVGEAVAVDSDGRLVISAEGREESVGAGDVVHVRPAADGGSAG
ncbi:biotin--[acetyl-CoA-carboxylase] ligase [Streptantibioticus ferralitis]|uniref:biotin--[biotin carboxyl-carrier protein] ligase n=1 Tax=Streptantibioticus ferralitis TaxID=236510 RepID=A0ABT5Z229_9ACTN|nr:biotin--[acetyl-CoA-carboxylase] ligase [Streptantibioticus ferralitis]MDF2257823.1 biotin--[acetyl-CoA-carboxylase] ligase [Streptantibioticus ferralitis]